MNIIYLHVNKQHNDYPEIWSDCTLEHSIHNPLTILGENTKIDGSESIIKVCCSSPMWLSEQPWFNSEALLNTYTDNSAIITLVTDFAWCGEPPGV